MIGPRGVGRAPYTHPPAYDDDHFGHISSHFYAPYRIDATPPPPLPSLPPTLGVVRLNLRSTVCVFSSLRPLLFSSLLQGSFKMMNFFFSLLNLAAAAAAAGESAGRVGSVAAVVETIGAS